MAKPNFFTEQLLETAGERLRARDFSAAEPLVSQALAADPQNVRGLCFQAVIAAETGRREQALALIGKALKWGPRMPAVINNAAAVFFQCGQPTRARQMWERLATMVPSSVDAHWNLAMFHVRQDDVDQAESHLRKVLQLAPDHPNLYINLGNLVKNSGRIGEAVALFKEGVRRQPDGLRESSNLLYSMHFDPAFGPEEIYLAHETWGRAFERETPCVERHENDRSPERRLRIGYVSPNFCAHVVGHNLLPLFRKHNRATVEVVCYSDTPKPDDVTEALKRGADVWRETRQLSDADLAEQVVEDKIDVLVDLVMHMEGVRLGVFARKPAPVQVTWMAYPGTTGLKRMDYRLTDAVLDPPALTGRFYTEKSVRLETFWCYDPPDDAPAVGPLPAEANGHVTFGCLNNFGKVNDAVLDVWRILLAAIPGSRLMVLLPPTGRTRTRLVEKLQVAPERVECFPRQSRQQYLSLYNRIDLALDPFPYTGHTTTLDGLWMGVPVITLAGSTAASRGSLSILSNLNLSELAAATKEDYASLGMGLANDPDRLRAFRSGMRERMQKSILMDADRFAQQVESAYRQMWQNWRK